MERPKHFLRVSGDILNISVIRLWESNLLYFLDLWSVFDLIDHDILLERPTNAFQIKGTRKIVYRRLGLVASNQAKIQLPYRALSNKILGPVYWHCSHSRFVKKNLITWSDCSFLLDSFLKQLVVRLLKIIGLWCNKEKMNSFKWLINSAKRNVCLKKKQKKKN